jgi:hypothetical protein
MYIAACTVLIVLTACNGGSYTSYTMSIDNRTQETLKIVYSRDTMARGGKDSIICIPKKDNVYYRVETRAEETVKDPLLCNAKTNIEVTNGRVLKKDISDSSNWLVAGNNLDGWKLTFVVTEDDIE